MGENAMTECINCKGVIKLEDYGVMGIEYYHIEKSSIWCDKMWGNAATATDEDFERDKELLDD